MSFNLVTQEENFYINQLKSINELIEKFNIIFNIEKNNITNMESDMKELLNVFEPNYLKYINIKRFAIPVIGRISSGKSTFLNFLLGLNNILESNTNISTKFVCIIRHNPLLNEPKAYSVILEERKIEKSIENDNNNIKIPKFNFEKGEELEGDIKNIIIEKNKKISENKNGLIKQEDYFLIIETKIPIFNNKELIEYSKIFEFMDLPGLNEIGGEDNFFKKNILPVIAYNIKFSFFIFDCLGLKDTDTIEINEWFRKRSLNKNNENCFYILNKIDLSTNKKEDEIQFKNYIQNTFDVDISKNSKNHFLGINSLLLFQESGKFNNFESYLKYKITEIKDGDGKNFKIYLKNEMEKDLNIPKINLKDYKIPILNENDENINKIINEVNKDLEYKNFNSNLNKNDYLKFSDIFKKNNPKEKNDSKEAKKITEKLISSIKNSAESFFNLFKYEKMLNNLMNKITKNNLNKDDDFYKTMEKLKKKKDFKYSLERLNSIKGMVINELLKLEPNNDFIKRIEKNYDNLVNFLNNDRKIRIAFLGLYSSGKSTILNTLIGKEILPTSSDECTNRGIIVRYHNKDEPELYKTKFIKKEDSDYYIFEDDNEIYKKGFRCVKEELETLNKVKCNFEDSFFVLKIKIDFLDEFCVENEIKERIEFIDFPGLHTENNFYEQNIFNPLMKFIDGFIFINKNDLIQENSNVVALRDIINRIESRKVDLNTDSFLFVLNNFTKDNLNVEKAQKDLDEIIFGKIYEKKGFWEKNMLNQQKYETKVVQFNAKLYENHLKFIVKIRDFKNFMESCINDMNDLEEENFLKYFNENYLSKFENLEISQTPNNDTIELSNTLNELLENKKIKIDKKTSNNICITYEAMKNNLFKHSLYKNSNAEQFFLNILVQIEKIKSNLDSTFKMIYNSYIKELLYLFEQINLNLLGNNLNRNISIENHKKEIENFSQKCLEAILKNNKYIKSVVEEEIKNYEKNYDFYNSNSDPQKELIKIVEKIKKSEEEYNNENKKELTEYINKLKNIRENLKFSKDNDDILKIEIEKIDDSIYKNFFSFGHGITHIGILGTEVIIRVCTAPFGPVAWMLAFAVHGAFAGGTALYDKLNKKKTLLKNLKKFKKELEIQLEGNKGSIIDFILGLHNDILKELEYLIDLQNSEFKGIKNKKKEFDNIFDKFKKIYNDDKD